MIIGSPLCNFRLTVNHLLDAKEVSMPWPENCLIIELSIVLKKYELAIFRAQNKLLVLSWSSSLEA